MKTKAQKAEEMAKAKVLLTKSQSLIFADFTNITAENLRKLRIELKKSGANFLVIKKRLLGILLKERGIDADLSKFKTSVGTIFAEGESDSIAGPAYKFFSGLEVPEGGAKDMWVKKILAGYDIKTAAALDADQIIYIGKLPPREVLLAQFLGMLTAPIRSFLYILDQKSKMGGSAAPATKVEEASAPSESAPASESNSGPDSNPDSDEKVELTQAQ